MTNIAELMGKARREDRAGWHHIHIEGDPFPRGFQHGYLLAHEIGEGMRVNKHLATWDTGDDWSFFVDWAKQLFLEKGRAMFGEYIEEMEGIAAGMTAAGVPTSFDDILAWNGYVELMFSWWPLHRDAPKPRPHMGDHRCSAFIATKGCTADGGIVVAHNTWDRYGNSDCFNVLVDIEPTDGQRIFMQAIPGCIASMTDWFVTSAGLLGTETTIAGFSGYDPKGAPEFFRARQAMQYSNTLDDFVKLLMHDNNSAYANSWMVGQRQTGEIMRLETGRGSHYGLERKSEGWFWGCNIANDLVIRNQNCTGVGYSDIRTATGARRVRWGQLLDAKYGEHYGKVDAELAKQMIADHYDVLSDKPDSPAANSLCGHNELDGNHGTAPYYPFGANDGKVVTSDLGGKMSFWARWGHACGREFNAKQFLQQHRQYDWLEGYLKDRPSQPWALFTAGQMGQ